jgi:regulatory protein
LKPTTEAHGASDIRRVAMDLLARREHSRQELADKLALRFADRPLIQQALDRLQQERLQSDQRFAEVFLHSRAQRLYGPLRIRAELRQRGVAEENIEAAFGQAAIEWQHNLQTLAATKFGRRPPADAKEKAKRLRFLQYRGFASGQIQRLWGAADAFE